MSLYRASDVLVKHREAIEAHLFGRICDLFSLEQTVTLYDLTNTYFEGRCAGNSKAALGHSKEKRTDAPLKHRKPLRPNPIAPWELRIGNQRAMFVGRAGGVIWPCEGGPRPGGSAGVAPVGLWGLWGWHSQNMAVASTVCRVEGRDTSCRAASIPRRLLRGRTPSIVTLRLGRSGFTLAAPGSNLSGWRSTRDPVSREQRSRTTG